MPLDEFRSDDVAYLAWVAAHPRGYVINIHRSLNASDARVHQADCHTITGEPARGNTWTGPYIKICSFALEELDGWARELLGLTIRRCGVCRPMIAAEGQQLAEPSRRQAPGAATIASAEPDADTKYETEGPGDDREVWLWGDRYIPFDRATPAQIGARDELRKRMLHLFAHPGEILHASYAGSKPRNSDIENVLLYNIDMGGASFVPSASSGVRFELAGHPRREAPSNGKFACSYQYRLIPPNDELTHWRREVRLAAFTDITLGQFAPAKRLEQTWLAVHRGGVEIGKHCITRDAPFGIFLSLEPPVGSRAAARPQLTKALVDGVVAALQAQHEGAAIDEAAARVGGVLLEEPRRIAEMLLDERRAVLGVVNRLVHLRGLGVQWNPGDHLCVVGEVLCAEPAGSDWRLSGEVWTVQQQA